MNFQDKVAIITGSAMGIWKGIAVTLANKGVHIAGIDIQKNRNEEMKKRSRLLALNAQNSIQN